MKIELQAISQDGEVVASLPDVSSSFVVKGGSWVNRNALTFHPGREVSIAGLQLCMVNQAGRLPAIKHSFPSPHLVPADKCLQFLPGHLTWKIEDEVVL